MRKIDLFFAEYRGNHKNRTNTLSHWIGVLLIFWTILSFISLIPSPHACVQYFGCISIVSCIVIALITLFYMRLSLVISLIMLAAMLLIERFTYTLNIHFGKNSWIIYVTVFFTTWILQFFSRKMEKKTSSYLKDLRLLLIGPIWLLGFILKKTGIRY